MADKRLSFWRLSAYSSPAIPIAALGLPLAVYLPAFYAGPMGLGLGAVGTIFMLARFWDVITDPIMGVLSDRYPSRWGRRRHWIVLSVPFLLLSSWFIFMPGAGPVSFWYLLGWLFVLYLGWTMLMLGHMSWGAELDDDYNERSRIQGFREAMTIIGIPMVLMLPVLIEKLGATDMEHARIEAMGLFVIILLPLTVAWAVMTVGERPHKSDAAITVKGAWKSLASNLALRRIVISDFFSGFSSAALGAMFIYEANYVWQVPQYASLLLLFYFIAGLGFIPLVLKISYRYGKHHTLVGSALFNSCMVPMVFLIPPGNVWVAAGILLFLGINVGALATLYRSVMADVADFDELETGQRRTGLFYSLLTLSQKVGAAVAVGVVFWVLEIVGFNPVGENSPEAIRGLSIVYVMTPLICNLLVALVMWNFPIGLKEQQDLRRRIQERTVEELESEERPPFG